MMRKRVLTGTARVLKNDQLVAITGGQGIVGNCAPNGDHVKDTPRASNGIGTSPS